MVSRVGITLVILLCGIGSAPAQVVRFETSIGDFDMVLNPTNNPRLEAHADNMLQYVENGNYNTSWINRADVSNGQNFVLQMGGFYSHTRRPPLTIDSTRPVATFEPVEGEPAATFDGLSNTIGTVALALPGLPTGGTNQDAGTSSFFINLASNTFLDADFTVFAVIPDMSVVNEIMALMKVDRTTDPLFGAGPGNLAFTDVPLMDNGQQVFIQRAFAVEDAMAVAQAMAGARSALALSAASASGGASSSSSAVASSVVPEPASFVLALLGMSPIVCHCLRRNKGPRHRQ